MMSDEDEGRSFKPMMPLTWWSSLFQRPISMAPTVNPNALSSETPSGSNLAGLNPEEQHARDKLIRYIVAQDIWKGTVHNACSWYSRYLQSKFLEHWHNLSAALTGLDEESKAPKENDLVILFEFMLKVGEVFKTKKECALTDIVDELSNHELLKDQLDGKRAIPNQIVFAAVGWLTMLYEATPDPPRDQLQIVIPTSASANSSGARNPPLNRKYRCDTQGFDHIDRSLYEMLGHFGQLIPGPPSTYLKENPTRRLLEVQSVCFATLQQIANLRIIWVSSLALHLELDSGNKTLKLFQNPSYCRMMTVEREKNLLSRFLNDHAERRWDDVENSDIFTNELFEEFLLTYRILFGQDHRSWKAFAKMASAWEGEQSTEKPRSCDPLLKTLCAQSCSAESAKIIYDEIDAGELANYYDPHAEFPFFANRLIELQEFVKRHQAQNVGGLLTDKPGVAAWGSLWSNQLLIFYATLATFMLVSLNFQIWQVILAKEQLKQGYKSPS